MKNIDCRALDKAATDPKITNPWRWDWMEAKDDEDKPLKLWMKRIDEAGKVFCIACDKTLMYGANGVRNLCNHGHDAKHKAAVTAREQNTTMPGAEVFMGHDFMTDRVAELKVNKYYINKK